MMECPVFYPTLAEFKNFEKYVEKIEKESIGFGMVKVIPPSGWRARKQGYQKINAMITHPVKQIVSGLAGIYQVIMVSEVSIPYRTYKKYSSARDPPEKLTIEELERQVFFI